MKKRPGSEGKLAEYKARCGQERNGWWVKAFAGFITRPAQRRAQWQVECMQCKYTTKKLWYEIGRHGCIECFNASRKNGSRTIEERMCTIRAIPRDILIEPDAVNALVEVFGAMSQAEVAILLGKMEIGEPLHKERIRQIERKAIRKLRGNVTKEMWGELCERERRPLTQWEEMEVGW